MEIAKCLVLSTAHISLNTNDKFEKIVKSDSYFPVRVAAHQYGYILFLRRELDEEDQNRLQTETPELLAIMHLAKKKKCTRIDLDRDGGVIDGLKNFDW